MSEARAANRLGEWKAFTLRCRRSLNELLAQCQHRLPTGQAVVGQIKRPTRAQALTYELHEPRPILRGYPAPHRMQRDEIESG